MTTTRLRGAVLEAAKHDAKRRRRDVGATLGLVFNHALPRDDRAAAIERYRDRLTDRLYLTGSPDAAVVSNERGVFLSVLLRPEFPPNEDTVPNRVRFPKAAAWLDIVVSGRKRACEAAKEVMLRDGRQRISLSAAARVDGPLRKELQAAKLEALWRKFRDRRGRRQWWED